MAGIRGKNTKPERLLRGALHRLGFRYRLHARFLPGSPDLFFAGLRAVVFVHGCFWHRHRECRYSTTPKANARFWRLKFSENVKRDAASQEALRESGYRVALVWECQLQSDEQATKTARRVGRWLASAMQRLEIPTRR